jgi:hypothetical protein
VECQLNYKEQSFSLPKVVSDLWGRKKGKKYISVPWGSTWGISASVGPSDLILLPYLLFMNHRGCRTEGFRLHSDRRNRRTSRRGGRWWQWRSEAEWRNISVETASLDVYAKYVLRSICQQVSLTFLLTS